MMTTSTNVTFILGKRGALNAVVDGYRYTKNRSYKENVYYRFVEQSTCSARITLTDGVLSSPLPEHSHSSQEAAIAVLEVKNNIKNRSAETDMPTKEIVADSLGALDFEGVANLNCQINALSKMSRLSKQNANRNLPPWRTSLFLLLTSPTGEGPEPKRRKWRMYNQRLSNIVNDLDDYDPMDFLYCIGEMLFTS
jgi:hypothetical protein